MTVMLFTGCKDTFEGKSIEELQKYSLKQLKNATPNEYMTQKDIEYCLKYSTRCLYLPDLTGLSKEMAKEIAIFKGYYLSLNGLETWDKETAKQIATFEGKYLHLNGLKNIDKETAKQIAKFKENIFI